MTQLAPFYSVVICTYQRYDRLPLAIESVLKQDLAPELYDVWIIDNTPSSPERAASRARYEGVPNLHYVEVNCPGLSNARNVAAQQSSARWLVFLDDDAVAAPDWLSRYHELISSMGEELGVVGGRVDPDYETPKPVWLDAQLVPFLSVFNWSPTVKEMPENITPFGANVAIRRDLIVQKGGFNTSLGRNGPESRNLMSGEESELFAYILWAGKKIFYTPFARVKHFIPASRLTRAWFRRRMAWQSVSDQPNIEPTPEDTMRMWVFMMDYLKNVPKEHLPYAGLFWDTEDPALFRNQIQAIQYMTHILLSEGGYPPQPQQENKGEA